MLTVRVLLIFSYNLDLDGAEFTFVHYLQQLLSGNPLYLNPESHPYSAVIYAPANLYLAYYTSRLFHLDYIHDIHTLYILGRSISFVFVLLCIYYVWQFSKRYAEDKNTQIISVCLFLLLLTGHAYAFRPDSMKIAFFIGFMYYYISYFYFDKNKKNAFLFLLFTLLSVLSKQDVVIYVMLIHFANFCVQRTIEIVLFCLLSAASIAILFLLLHLLFGPYCLVSLFDFNLQVISNVTKSYNLIVVICNAIRLFPLYLILIYLLIHAKQTKDAALLTMLCIAGLLSAFLSSFFLFRPGSFLNYTYEHISIILFAIVFFITNVKNKPKYSNLYIGYGIVLLFCGLIVKSYLVSLKNENGFKARYFELEKLRKDVLPYLNNNEAVFPANIELCLFIADKNVVYGHEYHLDRALYANFGLTATSRLLHIDSKPYDDKFKNGEIPYLLYINKETTNTVVAEYYPNYREFQKPGNYILAKYQPLQ